MSLTTKEYRTITYISGPLLYLENVRDLPFGSMVEITLPTGDIRNGQVLEVNEQYVLIQILEKTIGMDVKKTSVRLKEEVARIGVSSEMVGRIFDGTSRPIDGLGEVAAEKRLQDGLDFLGIGVLQPERLDNRPARGSARACRRCVDLDNGSLGAIREAVDGDERVEGLLEGHVLERGGDVRGDVAGRDDAEVELFGQDAESDLERDVLHGEILNAGGGVLDEVGGPHGRRLVGSDGIGARQDEQRRDSKAEKGFHSVTP